MNLRSSLPFVAVFLVTLILKGNCVNSEDLDYEYGDPDVFYDSLDPKFEGPVIGASKDVNSVLRLPLCCPEGEVYNRDECLLPHVGINWKPQLDGAVDSPLEYKGFPTCDIQANFIETYQKEVHFGESEAQAFLPYYVQLMPVPKNQYCIVKIVDDGLETCESFQTKIFSCLTEEKDPQALKWISVSLAHILLFLTLLTYFCIGDLRCLQGQYMICFLISMLIYNVCLLPGSELPLDISDVSCIALGAVKYFFFCGIFLWFNTICFDTWRTLSNRQDISGRKRFLIYSAYSWVMGAILTTVVLVLPYTREGNSGSREDPLKDKDYTNCKLKIQMNMILQISQFISLFLDLIFLILATCAICSYSKFGNGLTRFDATLCLKQGWKLFVIMIAHMVSCIDADMLRFPVPLWLYLLFECAAIFGVFAYRSTILKRLSKIFCRSNCLPGRENGSLNEKGQLTMT